MVSGALFYDSLVTSIVPQIPCHSETLVTMFSRFAVVLERSLHGSNVLLTSFQLNLACVVEHNQLDVLFICFFAWQGSQVDSVADKNLTPLHMAVSTGSKACVEILVAANANVNSENDRGQTPLHDVLMRQSMTTDGDTPDTFVTQSAAAPQIDQVGLIL